MLIIEDQPQMRSALRTFLKLAHPAIDIFEAADGASALALCRTHTFRLVLLDLRLPDINGIELIAPIKESNPDCSIIIVSHHSPAAYAERALAAGAGAYVAKNAIFRDLGPAIDRALHARELG